MGFQFSGTLNHTGKTTAKKKKVNFLQALTIWLRGSSTPSVNLQMTMKLGGSVDLREGRKAL